MKVAEAHKKWDDLFSQIKKDNTEIDSIKSHVETAKTDIDNLNTNINGMNKTISDVIDKLPEMETQLKSITDKQAVSESLVTDMNSNVEELENKLNETNELLKINKEQQGKIQDMLEKAAAGSLFNSFNSRGKKHFWSSWLWFFFIISSLVSIVFGSFHLISGLSNNQPIDNIFLMKLTISFPMIYFLIFSTQRYVKEKRLEEEYAYRGAIALSLEAYKGLIEKQSPDDTKYENVVNFISDATNKIFTSPTESLSKHPHKEDRDTISKMLDSIKEIASKIPK